MSDQSTSNRLSNDNLAAKILYALLAGAVLGSALQWGCDAQGIVQTFLVYGIANAIGTMFIAMIKMLVVPLVFISIVHAVCSLDDMAQVGRLGSKTFMIYLLNTVLAIISALGVAMLLQPGSSANLGVAERFTGSEATELPSFLNMLINVVPSNPFAAFVEGNILQLLFMAIITGIAIKRLENHETHSVSSAISVANNLMMKLVTMVMGLAPYGVFFLTLKLAATLNGSSILSVLSYVGTGLLVMLLWVLVFYPIIIGVLLKKSPLFFLRNIRSQALFALSTSSSNASIPITFKTLIERFNVPSHVAGFTVPLGATINMSGSAIYMAVAAIFVANAWHIELSMLDIGTIAFTTFLLAIATGGVPGGVVVSAGVLLQTLGLPVEALGIILATDRIMDAGCTLVNVIGNTVAGIICGLGEETPSAGNCTQNETPSTTLTS